MIYLGNGMYSDSSLSHGGKWKTHKYIAIKNGRYIYPGDNTGSSNNGNNGKDIQLPGPYSRQLTDKDRDRLREEYNMTDSDHSGVKGPYPYATGLIKTYGENKNRWDTTLGSAYMNYAKQLDKRINDNVNRAKTITSNAKIVNDGVAKSKAKLTKKAPLPEVKPPKMGQSKQGPSAAEKAQTIRYYGTQINGQYDYAEAQSRHTNKGDVGAKTPKEILGRRAKYGHMGYSTQGPSTAEKAQTERSKKNDNEGVKAYSKTTTTTHKHKKDKVADLKKKTKKGLKKLGKDIADLGNGAKSWAKKNIIGEEGKVYTGKELEKKKRHEKRNK